MPRALDCGLRRRAVTRQADESGERKDARLHQRVVLGDDQIFENRHPGEQPDILKGASNAGAARDPEPLDAFELEYLTVLVHCEAAGARPVEAGQAIENRSLASAVRTDDRGDLVAVGGERNIVNRNQSAKAHRQMLDREQRCRDFGAGHCAGLALRRKVGSRCAISPRGRHTITPTIAAPKINIRKSAKARPNSGRLTSRIAASTTPNWLPMPPSTTIARIVADSMNVKLSGLIKPCRVAKKQPAKPPNIAPIAKAESLTLVGLIPSARQAISSSRSASQARPTGSRRMRNVKRFVISARTRIR